MTKIAYPLFYQRRKTKTVWVKDIPIGSEHPIVIQSMLTSQTNSPLCCIQEMKDLKEVGCQIIRLAVPSRKSLEPMPEIRRLMKEEGINVPLTADIHFAPHLAIDSCEFFDKIRINPGNFSDRSKNSTARSKLAFDLEEGKQKFRERIAPLAKKLIKKKLALRIGVNQGSLSSRMLQAYGDTPLGMVESALEAISLFREYHFENIIVSLKSSNPLVVQKAYRLFCQKSSLPVPLHLGVTEAGDETAGRVKSLVGIAPLLFDGIGDTIRISLTEDSCNEILFAKKFLSQFSEKQKEVNFSKKLVPNFLQDLKTYRSHNKPLVFANKTKLADSSNVKIGKLKAQQFSQEDFFEIDFDYYQEKEDFFFDGEEKPLYLWKETTQKIPNEKSFKEQRYSAFLLTFENPVRSVRFIYQKYKKFSLPIGIMLPAKNLNNDYKLELQLGCLLGEGLLDFLLLHPKTTKTQLVRLSYLLQATKTKISRTEFIACPSCGRTLFNLQEVTAKVKAKTGHLKGVKIGIMGCMVNGPGEMADADFGYVGSATGKVDLYLGHQKIIKGIKEEFAVENLIELIKQEGKWQEPVMKNG